MEQEQDQGQEQDINPHIARVNAFRDQYKDVLLIDCCRALAEVKRKKEELDEQLKAVNAEFDVLRIDVIPQKMEDEGVSSPFNVKGVGSVRITADLRTRTTNEAEFFKWLRDNKMGDLIKETIAPSTLKAWAKNRIVSGKVYPEELLKIETFSRASITRTGI